MSRKKWCVARSDKDLACDIAERHNIDPFAAVLLVSRGITDDQDIESFFSSEPMLCDPFERCRNRIPPNPPDPSDPST